MQGNIPPRTVRLGEVGKQVSGIALTVLFGNWNSFRTFWTSVRAPYDQSSKVRDDRSLFDLNLGVFKSLKWPYLRSLNTGKSTTSLPMSGLRLSLRGRGLPTAARRPSSRAPGTPSHTQDRRTESQANNASGERPCAAEREKRGGKFARYRHPPFTDKQQQSQKEPSKRKSGGKRRKNSEHVECPFVFFQ